MDNYARLLYLVLLLVLIGAGSGVWWRTSREKTLRYAIIWLAIVLLLVFGYSLRSQFN